MDINNEEEILKLYNELIKTERFNLSYEDFSKNTDNLEIYNKMYNYAVEIYKNKERYIEKYVNSFKNNIPLKYRRKLINNSNDSFFEKQRKINIYKKEMERKFGSLTDSLNTMLNAFLDYRKVLAANNNETWNFLVTCIVSDKEKLESIFSSAEKNLNTIFNYLTPSISESEKDDFLNINNDMYLNEIRRYNNINNYIIKNYNLGDLRVLHSSSIKDSKTSEKIISSCENTMSVLRDKKVKFSKTYELKDNLMVIVNLQSIVYKEIPIRLFNPDLPMDEKITQLKYSDVLKNCYLLCKSKPNVSEVFKIYQANKSKKIFSNIGMHIDKALNIIFKCMELLNLIKNYSARDISLEELFDLSYDELDELKSKYKMEEELYSNISKDNKDIRLYHKIYLKYKNCFNNRMFSECIEEIRKRCNYLKENHSIITEESILENYTLTDEELKESLDNVKKYRMVDFIINNNPKYNEKLKVMLLLMSMDELKKLYDETWLISINNNHPKYIENNMLIDEYLSYDEEEKRKLQLETDTAILVSKINSIRKADGKELLDYQEVLKLDREQYFELIYEYVGYLRNNQIHKKDDISLNKKKNINDEDSYHSTDELNKMLGENIDSSVESIFNNPKKQ